MTTILIGIIPPELLFTYRVDLKFRHAAGKAQCKQLLMCIIVSQLFSMFLIRILLKSLFEEYAMQHSKSAIFNVHTEDINIKY